MPFLCRLMIPMLLLMGLGIHLRWHRDQKSVLLKQLKPIAWLSLLLPVVFMWALNRELNYQALLGLILATWVVLSTLSAAYKKILERGLSGIAQAYWGMVLAHLGVAVTVIGIALSTNYGIQKDVLMHPGQRVKLAGYSIQFLHQSPFTGPNYKGTQAAFLISNQAKSKIIYPEKRLYTVGQMAMTEAAIDVNPFRDLYLALGEPFKAESWSVRIYFKPFIRWIWGGGFMILAGGLLALSDRRYYKGKAANRVVAQEQGVG